MRLRDKVAGTPNSPAEICITKRRRRQTAAQRPKLASQCHNTPSPRKPIDLDIIRVGELVDAGERCS